MRPVSPEFQTALANPHTVCTHVTLTTPTGDVLILEPIDGSVTLDATAANRGTCELTLADEALIPTVAGDPLTPYGSEVKISRGIRLADDTEELVSLGVFGLDPVEVTDSGDTLEIRASGTDRSRRVSDEKFEAPYQVPKGRLFTAAIAKLIREVFPGIAINSVASEITTPFMMAWEEGTDRWTVAQDLALGIACELYFDGDGIPTLRPVGNIQIQWEVSEGEDGVLLDAAKTWTREGIFNRWIVTGENSGEGVFRGVATDDDPASPTRYGGPFGKVTRMESFEFVASDQQATDVARMLKQKQFGLTQQVSFGSIVNPALEPDDVVQIIRVRAGVAETRILDSVTIPLGPDQPMSGQTRALGLFTAPATGEEGGIDIPTPVGDTYGEDTYGEGYYGDPS